MAYIGAESPSDWLLHDIRKGTRTDQTLAAIETCRSHGVIPELSFMLAPPQDPEGETETHLRVHPPDQARSSGDRDHDLHLHAAAAAPRHQQRPARRAWTATLRDCAAARRSHFPRRADDWAQPQWLDYWCHKDAPWLSAAAARAHRRLHHRAGLPLSDHHGHPRAAAGASRRCARWPRGAIASSATTIPGSCASRSKLIRQWDPRVLSL